MLKRLSSNPKISAVEPFHYTPPELKRNSPFRPVIVGFGPAGMMAGLLLARAGLKPLILERGRDIDSRQKDVNRFWQFRELDEPQTYSLARAVQVHFLTESSQQASRTNAAVRYF